MSTLNNILEDLSNSRDGEILEMARVGYFPIGTKSMEIYIHTDDPGKIPHFHIRKRGDRGFEWETCIRFDSAEYFLHGHYKDKLPNKKIARELDKALRTIDIRDRNKNTYWEECIDEWNRNNSDIMLDLNIKQPDYTKLSVGK